MVINGSLVKFLGEIHPSLFKYGPLMKQHLCFLGMCSGSAIFIAYLWGVWCIFSTILVKGEGEVDWHYWFGVYLVLYMLSLFPVLLFMLSFLI
jgi:hypothetical protein